MQQDVLWRRHERRAMRGVLLQCLSLLMQQRLRVDAAAGNVRAQP
jgi:hypothetical protein